MKTTWLSCLSVFAVTALFACDDDAIDIGPDAGVDAGGNQDATVPVACPTGGANGTVMMTILSPVTLTPLARLVGSPGSVPIELTANTPVALPAGSYTLQVKRVKVAPSAGELIGKAYYVSAAAFDGCVRSGLSTPITLTYAQEPGTGKVWVTPANGAGAVVAYDEAQLRAGGASNAPTVVRQMGITAASDIAFDLQGNLWVADHGVGGGLLAYPMLTLGGAADRPPAVKLPGHDNILSMTFDGEGNLWVGQGLAGQPMDRIVKFSAADLAVDPTSAATSTTQRSALPAVTLTSAELKNAADLAFDSSGNLWVASADKDEVLMFSAAQLAAGGSIAPTVALEAQRATGPILGPIRRPEALSFDATGNLWVAWESVLKLTPAQLAASATLADPFSVQPKGMGPAGVSSGPHAFDATGGLWFSRTNLGGPAALVRVPAAGLMAGGEQDTSPNMPSEGLGNGASAIVMNPTPPGLPIRD